MSASVFRVWLSVLGRVFAACGGGSDPAAVDAPIANDAAVDATIAGPREASGHVYAGMFLGGILSFAIDPVGGALQPLPDQTAVPGDQIYAIAVHPSGEYLYAVELATREVAAFRIQADGALAALPGPRVATHESPTSISVDPKGRFVFVGSTTDNTVLVYRIDPATGALTALTDATITIASVPAFAAVEPSGKFLYVSTLNGIRAYAIAEATGKLDEIEGSPFGEMAVFSGAIMFHPGGAFLYNSGGSLNGFRIDPASGALTALPGSPFATRVQSDRSALNLAISPDGAMVFATSLFIDGTFWTFRVDPTTGVLTPGTGAPFASGSAPYSIAVDRTGSTVYVGDDSGTISAFAIDAANGAARRLDGPPTPIRGLQPELVVIDPPPASDRTPSGH